jgi:hypothetical protein
MSHKLTQDLEEYNGKNERISGFKKMQNTGLKIPFPLKILTNEMFLSYKKDQLNDSLKLLIETVFNEIKSANPNKGIAIRRAYFVPGFEYPPGPRSASVETVDVAIEEVKKIFDFAIQNKLDKQDSEIEVFMHPFINPEPPMIGGSITPHRNEGNEIIIESIYGNDEGVQSFPHDSYIVDYSKKEIIEKVIQNKSKCLKIMKGSYEVFEISENLRNKQILNDELIISLSNEFEKVSTLVGQCRLEFAIIEEGVYFTECIPFLVKTQQKIPHEVYRVKNVQDIEKLKSGDIVYIDPQIIRERRMDLITSLAFKLPQGTVILYPGSTTTAHSAIILRESGHKVIFVGQREFQTGEKMDADLLLR